MIVGNAMLLGQTNTNVTHAQMKQVNASKINIHESERTHVTWRPCSLLIALHLTTEPKFILVVYKGAIGSVDSLLLGGERKSVEILASVIH